jgi:hypothetical protein
MESLPRACMIHRGLMLGPCACTLDDADVTSHVVRTPVTSNWIVQQLSQVTYECKTTLPETKTCTPDVPLSERRVNPYVVRKGIKVCFTASMHVH